MIKKMWADIDGLKKPYRILTLLRDRTTIYFNKVFVTDKDPFENVREFFCKSTDKDFKEWLIELREIIKKDISNWDKAIKGGVNER